MNATEIKQTFEDYVNEYDPTLLFSQGSVLGVLSKACGGDAKRHEVLKVLTGHSSSKELLPPQWYALYKLVLPAKIGGHWTTERGEIELEAICGVLLAEANNQPGQIQLFENDPGKHPDIVIVDDIDPEAEKLMNYFQNLPETEGDEPPF